MNELIRQIIETVIDRDNRIISPEVGSIVFLKEDGRFIPVKILRGQFYGKHGVSNFWYWMNLETNKEEHGYGCFYKEKKDG